MKRNKTFEQRFISRLMYRGKYIKAENLYMNIIKKMKQLKIKNIYKYVRRAIYNITPIIGIRYHKKGRRVQRIPIYLTSRQAERYALNWLFKVIKKKKITNFVNKLVQEIINAYRKVGAVMRQKWKLYTKVRDTLKRFGKQAMKRSYLRHSVKKNSIQKRYIKQTTKMRKIFKRRKWLKVGKF